MSGYYEVKPREFTPKFKRKYARMWAEANKWQIPLDLEFMPEPMESGDDTPLKGDPVKTAYWAGIWAVLDALCEDGIIPDEYLEKAANRLEKSA